MRLRNWLAIRTGEGVPVLRAALTGFLLWCGYGILRPVRDGVAAAGHTEVSSLWTGTFFAALLALPIYSWLAARTPRRALVPRVYAVFAAVLVAFWALFTASDPDGPVRLWSDRAFYVWVSTYNLFVLSLLWSLASEAFRSEQGKRLFGLVAAGVTIGQLSGSAITAFLVESIGIASLLLVSAATLLGAAMSVRGVLARQANVPLRSPEERIGGGWWQGLRQLAADPFLRAVTIYLLLFLVGSGVLYIVKNDLVRAAFPEREARASFLAKVELCTNLGTLLLQLFVTGRWLPRFGVAATLAVVPLVTLLGFSALALAPGLLMVAGVEVARRISEFAMSKPAREVLFTVGGRQARFQSKPVMDTLIYRGGDLGVAKGFEAARGAGLAVAGSALAVLPFAVAGLGMAVLLGRMHARREATVSDR